MRMNCEGGDGLVPRRRMPDAQFFDGPSNFSHSLMCCSIVKSVVVSSLLEQPLNTNSTFGISTFIFFFLNISPQYQSAAWLSHLLHKHRHRHRRGIFIICQPPKILIALTVLCLF